MTSADKRSAMYYKPDIVATYRERFKKSSNERIRKLSKSDIDELWEEFGAGLADILEAAPTHGFNGIRLGEAGAIKLSVRQPQKITDVYHGKEVVTSPTPLFYFKASQKLKDRLKKVLTQEIE